MPLPAYLRPLPPRDCAISSVMARQGLSRVARFAGFTLRKPQSERLVVTRFLKKGDKGLLRSYEQNDDCPSKEED